MSRNGVTKTGRAMAAEWRPIFRGRNNNRALPQQLFLAAVESDYPVALWRMPLQQQVNAVVELAAPNCVDAFDLHNIGAGFMFAPFVPQEAAPAVLIDADIYLRGGDCYFRKPAHCGDQTGDLEHRFQNFSETVQRLAHGNGAHGHQASSMPETNSSEAPPPDICQEDYQSWIDNAVAAIRGGQLRKVVLSRAVTVALPEPCRPFELFQRLCSHFPRAFVSLVAIPGIGIWIGATPELLLRVQPETITTVALAGTAVANPDVPNPWSRKEIVEQEIVSEYIRNCFYALDRHDFNETAPETVQIGQLLHLKTRFQLQRRDVNAGFINEFIRQLHPTPAVCGVAKDKALAFIEAFERHRRAYYAGYLGPVNIADETHLFVNLRCMQLLGSRAILYAGGGITIDSDPQQEWHETELKLDALRNLLHCRAASAPVHPASETSKLLNDEVPLDG